MKILGTTEYVDYSVQQEPWYQLSVISQWDWDIKPVAFKNGFSYSLEYFYEVFPERGSATFIHVDILTDEMKTELINMGYVLSSRWRV